MDKEMSYFERTCQEILNHFQGDESDPIYLTCYFALLYIIYGHGFTKKEQKMSRECIKDIWNGQKINRVYISSIDNDNLPEYLLNKYICISFDFLQIKFLYKSNYLYINIFHKQLGTIDNFKIANNA
jgi:hypothetical protein